MPSEPRREQSGPAEPRRTCRMCGRDLPEAERAAVKGRLLAAFPKMTRRHAYCAECGPLVEDLLDAALRPSCAALPVEHER